MEKHGQNVHNLLWSRVRDPPLSMRFFVHFKGSGPAGGSWQSMSPSTVTLSPGSWMDLPGGTSGPKIGKLRHFTKTPELELNLIQTAGGKHGDF